MSSARKGYRQCSKCKRNRATKFFSSARGRVCADCRKRRTQYASREQRLMAVHYITLEEDAKLLEVQHGRCAICGGLRPYEMDVDHDHAVERELLAQGVPAGLAHRRSLRGKLCKRCNRRLLPSAKDDPVILQNAIDYLKFPPAQEHRVLGEGEAWVR